MKTKILATVVKETEKALQVEIVYNHRNSGSEKIWKAWMPKSHAIIINENTIEASTWLVKKIDTEICEFQKCFKMNDVDCIIING